MKRKKALVFGGAGFLASYLCDQLDKKGIDVKIFDLKKKNDYIKKYTKIIGNICDKKKVYNSMKNIDYVYHFAAISDIDECNRNPLNSVTTNIIGTLNILDACIKNNVKRIVFASSIYALSNQGGFYSTTKRTCETLIENYTNKYKLNYTILRFGSLYGPRANSFNSIYQLIKYGMKNKKIKRNGDGNEVRSYINVKNVSEICVEILKQKYQNSIINVIGKKKLKVKQVIGLIAKKLNIKNIIYNKDKINEYHYKVNPYTYKIKKGIFYKKRKQINISEGIDEIINEIKKENNFKRI